MKDQHVRSSKGVFWVALIGVIVLSGLVLMGKLRTTSFRGDESGWISAGYYYTDLLSKGHSSWEQWQCQSCGAWGRLNPQLGKWLVGIPVTVYSDKKLQGVRFDKYYDFNKTLQENVGDGRVPSPEILLVARRASLVFGVLSCAIVFVTGYVSANLAAGLLAAGLLLTNRVFVSSATSAMTDIHYLFFLLCLVLAALWFVTRPKMAGWAAIAGGLFAGLACSVKVTGIAVAGLVFLLVVVDSLIKHRLRVRQTLLFLYLFLLTAIAVVYVLNPYFWPSFTGVRGSVVVNELQEFSKESSPVNLLVEGIPPESYPQLAKLARPVEFPLMARRWSLFMDQQASDAGWGSGNRLIDIHGVLASKLATIPMLWIALLVGLGVSARRLWISYRGRTVSPLIVPVAFFAANYVFILLFLKLNWPRYYLPTLAGASILASIGIIAFVSQVIVKSRAWHVHG